MMMPPALKGTGKLYVQVLRRMQAHRLCQPMRRQELAARLAGNQLFSLQYQALKVHLRRSVRLMKP